MNAVVQNFIGTTEEWETENPILYEAVLGFEKMKEGKLLMKVGDGVSTWNDLKYFNEDQSQKIAELEKRILILNNQFGIVPPVSTPEEEPITSWEATDEIEPEQEEKIDEDDITDEDLNEYAEENDAWDDNEPDNDESNDNQETEE